MTRLALLLQPVLRLQSPCFILRSHRSHLQSASPFFTCLIACFLVCPVGGRGSNLCNLRVFSLDNRRDFNRSFHFLLLSSFLTVGLKHHTPLKLLPSWPLIGENRLSVKFLQKTPASLQCSCSTPHSSSSSALKDYIFRLLRANGQQELFLPGKVGMVKEGKFS